MGISLRWTALLLLAPSLSLAVACEDTATTAPAKAAPTPTVNEEPPPVKRSRERPTTDAVDASVSPTPANTVATAAVDGGNPGVQGMMPNGMLTPSDILAVVRAQTSVLKKTCWDIDGGGAQSANVQLSIVVGLDGRVHNTSVRGDEPVASCIAAAANAWTFPTPQVETPVNIPFRFVKR